jgi:hypothetical protein
VAPGGQGADEQKDQDGDQDNSHDIFPLSTILSSFKNPTVYWIAMGVRSDVS